MNPNSHKRTVDVGNPKTVFPKSSIGKKRKILTDTSAPKKKAKADYSRAMELNFKGGEEGIKKLREKLLAKIKPVIESSKKQASHTIKRSSKISDLKKVARKKIVSRGLTTELKMVARRKVADRGNTSVLNNLPRNGSISVLSNLPRNGGALTQVARKKSGFSATRTSTSAGTVDAKSVSLQRAIGNKRRVIGISKKKVEANTKRPSIAKEAVGALKPQVKPTPRAVSRFWATKVNNASMLKLKGTAVVKTTVAGMDPSKLPKPGGNFKVRIGNKASLVRNVQPNSSISGRQPISSLPGGKPSQSTNTPSVSSSPYVQLGLNPRKPPLDPSHGELNFDKSQLQLQDSRKPSTKLSVMQVATGAAQKVSNSSKGIMISCPSPGAIITKIPMKLSKKFGQSASENWKSRSLTPSKALPRRNKAKLPIPPKRAAKKITSKEFSIKRKKKPLPHKTKPKKKKPKKVSPRPVARKLQLDVKSFMEQKVWLGHLHREFQKYISSGAKIVEKSYPYLENVEWILRRKRERYPDVRVEDPPKIVLK